MADFCLLTGHLSAPLLQLLAGEQARNASPKFIILPEDWSS